MDKLEKQKCPFCFKDTLTLIEDETEVPYFGKVFIFSMECSSCEARQADIEAAEPKEPSKFTFTVESEKDLEIRVVKSSAATIKVPQMRITVTPGPASEGYISNIEGLLNRFEEVIEKAKESTDDNDEKKKAKNLLKKLRKVKYGDIPLKIIIEDPTGNSAIISDKAKIEKLKGKK
jgi:zinc finger protein